MDTTADIQAAGESVVDRPDRPTPERATPDRATPDRANPAVSATSAPNVAPMNVAAMIVALRKLVDRMQVARRGSAELDGQVDEALRGSVGCPAELPLGPRWSCDLDHAMALVPQSYNYSFGRRDGVCWAWIQPNDRWEPAEYEARHDHPGGSGLVVAHTAALAVACAAVILRIRRLEAGDAQAA